MRLLPLDMLRILAASLVIMAHTGLPAIGGLSTGGYGVTLFLIMSGLLLALTDRQQPWRSFMRHRMSRIYPMYWASLALSMLIVWKLPQDLAEASLTVTGTCAFAGKWGCSIAPTSWFIGLIMALYAIYPLIKDCLKQYPLLTLTGLYAVSMFMQRRGVIWMGLEGSPEKWFPLCRAFEFGIGVALAQKMTSFAPCPSPSWLQYVAELSFPAFLLHVPLTQWGLPLPIYLVALVLLSAAALRLTALTIDAYNAFHWPTEIWHSPLRRPNTAIALPPDTA